MEESGAPLEELTPRHTSARGWSRSSGAHDVVVDLGAVQVARDVGVREARWAR